MTRISDEMDISRTFPAFSTHRKADEELNISGNLWKSNSSLITNKN